MPRELGLLVDFSIIMVVAGVVIVAFQRLHLPVVLGYLVAGLIVGPYTPPFALVRDTQTIAQLADFGIILLLFSLGLDFNLNKLRHIGIVVIITGFLEVLSALFLGYGIARLLGWGVTDSLFLASALSISSTAIVVKVLTDLGKTDLLSSRITFGILILEDFIAVLLMVLLSGLVSTGEMSWLNVGALSLRLVILAVATLVLGRLIVPRVLDLVAKLQSRETLVIASLALCFSMALISKFLGLSVAAGAFLIGAIISESRHMEEIGRLLTPIRDMFGAIFFVTMGMLIDVSVLNQYLGPILLISAFAVLGKIAFASLGAYFSGYGGKTSFRVGVALSQRGEFSLVIAKIGSDAQAIAPFVYPVVAGVTLATTVVSPLLIRGADGIADKMTHLTPRAVREYGVYLGTMLHAVRRAAARRLPLSRTLQHEVSVIAINLLIIGVVFLSGSFVVEIADSLATRLGQPLNMVKLGIGLATVIVSLPPAIVIWRSLGTILNVVLETTVWSNTVVAALGQRMARLILRNTILLVLLIGLGILSAPLVLRMLVLGLPYFMTLPVLALAFVVYLQWNSLRRFHQRIEQLYRQGLMGEKESRAEEAGRGEEK